MWAVAERREGRPIANWWSSVKRHWECGDSTELETPNANHWGWHKRNGTEVCGKARGEAAWRVAEIKAGHPIPDYKYRPNKVGDYECGSADEAEEPGQGHYMWHFLKMKTKPCERARAENAWAAAEMRYGRPLPDYEYCSGIDRNKRTAVYRIMGYGDEIDIYLGKSQQPYTRYQRHQKSYTLVGEMIKSKAVPITFEILSWWPTWDAASDEEERLIKEGNPFGGRLLNIVFKDFDTDEVLPEPVWKDAANQATKKQLVKLPPHTCGKVEDMETASSNHYHWHHGRKEPACGKAMAEAGWANAEKRAGQPVPDYVYDPDRPLVVYECGEAEDATGPNGAHIAWHRYKGTPACGKSLKESAWHRAERKSGHPIEDYDYRPVYLGDYECGEAEDATGPSTKHYRWHKRNGTEPCGLSIKENRWQRAERKAERAVPDYKMTRRVGDYVCGTAEDRERPSGAHAGWHYKRGEKPCEKALAETAWYGAVRRAGGAVPDFEYVPLAAQHICGEAEDATGPNGNHSGWHRHNGTPVCGKAKREAAWYQAENTAGHPIPDYRPSKNMDGYECGEYDERETPSGRHYGWHENSGTEPCGKSRAEVAWYRAERVAGRPLPDWQPKKPVVYECGSREEAEKPSRNHYDWHRDKNTEQCGKALEEAAWYGRRLKAKKAERLVVSQTGEGKTGQQTLFAIR